MSAVAPAHADGAAPHGEELRGSVYALCAFGMWGLAPIYFKALAGTPPLDVLAHRLVWSVLFVAVLITWRGTWYKVRTLLASRRKVAILAGSAVLVASNWLTFIWAIDNNRVIETSLGYYINPLLNVALGVVFLRERLRRVQMLAVAVACGGVLVLIVQAGEVPWVSLYLAASFGTYGLVRKVAGIEGLPGLFVETLVLAPVSLVYVLFVAPAPSSSTLGLLSLAGPVTALPLLAFVEAARRLRLSTLGFFQYLGPTGQLLLGVLAYHEPFTRAHAWAFGLIWVALGIYSADAWAKGRAR